MQHKTKSLSLIFAILLSQMISMISAADIENPPTVETEIDEPILTGFKIFQDPSIFSDEADLDLDGNSNSESESENESKIRNKGKTNNIVTKESENNNSKNKNNDNKIRLNFDDHSLYSDELTSEEYDEILKINFEQKQHERTEANQENKYDHMERSKHVDAVADRDDDEHEYQEQNHEWDVLIFTQQWPVTTCYHWRESDKTHACKLPSKKEFWTIHGIWPTKKGEFGPSFCNKTADFNVDQLKTISERLNQYWPDIDGNSNHDWLWKHEWLKHGTCAAHLEQLDDELKYFGQGLIWRDDYSVESILSSANIHPDSNNTIIALQTALVKGLGGKNPSIHCLYDSKTDISYLAEIRICFNKTLDLISCDGVKTGNAVEVDYPGGTVITNCHISMPVHYPSLVPPVQRQQNSNNWKLHVVNMYKLLQFIMWFTL